MADYKKMYLTLFRDITKAIDILQAAQQKAEEIYLSDDSEDYVTLLNPDREALPKKQTHYK